MTVSVITPTCDRPVGFAICEQWMARQTRQPDEWIVADGGQTPVVCTQGTTAPPPTAARQAYTNFISNVSRGVEAATGHILVIVEDDDWYHPTHLEVLLGQFTPGIQACGDDAQRYYNVQHRVWHLYPNKGASLCQTAFRREALPHFKRALIEQPDRRAVMVWMGVSGPACPISVKSLKRTQTVLGIKGLPGRVGLGVGHRPQIPQWNRDPKLTQLKAWIGPHDAAVYGGLWARA